MIDLHGWTIVGLRASDQQAPLRRLARASGAAFLSLPGLRLLPVADAAAARVALHSALACPVCIYTSPAAVRFARGLADLQSSSAQAVAIGSGSAAALRRVGVRTVVAPTQAMHSEGVLALPVLSPPPAQVGLVTAPGGRGEILRVLRVRGAQVQVAEVYRREAATLSARARQKLQAIGGPSAVLVSSADALQAVHAQLDHDGRTRLLRSVAVCASQRLLQLASSLGFSDLIECASTQPRIQLAALSRMFPERVR
jgi:uroporphyrinogen-III synthase